MTTKDRLRVVAAEPIARRAHSSATDWFRHGGQLIKYPVRMGLSRDLTDSEWALLERVTATVDYRSIEVLSSRTIELVTTVETLKDKPEVFQGMLDEVGQQAERHDFAYGRTSAEVAEQARREAVAKSIIF